MRKLSVSRKFDRRASKKYQWIIRNRCTWVYRDALQWGLSTVLRRKLKGDVSGSRGNTGNVDSILKTKLRNMRVRKTEWLNVISCTSASYYFLSTLMRLVDMWPTILFGRHPWKMTEVWFFTLTMSHNISLFDLRTYMFANMLTSKKARKKC